MNALHRAAITPTGAAGHLGSPRSTDPAGQIGWRGQGLMRPECVLANAAGDLFCADWRGGIAHLRADGTQALYTAVRPSIVSNRVLRIAPNGESTLWLEDADAEHLAWAEAAYQDGTMDRRHLDQLRSRELRNLSSIAFSGADRRTAVFGCLLGERLATLAMPAAGVEPPHWNVA